MRVQCKKCKWVFDDESFKVCPKCGTPIGEEPQEEAVVVEEDNNMAEKTCIVIASAILFCSALASVALFIYGKDSSSVGIFVICGIVVLVSGSFYWALLKVFTNISLTLKQINKKLNE